MSSDIQLVKVGEEWLVSSKEVAEKFGRKHYHVLEAYRSLIAEIQDPDFIATTFRCNVINTLKGEEISEVVMTRDGFTMLAMGFTGAVAIQWRLKFLAAFNAMERTIAEELPALRNRIKELEAQSARQLHAPKRMHGNKNTVLVPEIRQTLFNEHEVYYVRVPRNDPHYSEASYKEGELKRLSGLMRGMSAKIAEISEEIARLRRV